MKEAIELASGPLDAEESFSLAVVRSPKGILLGRKTRGFGKGKLVLSGGKDQHYLSGEGLGVVPGGHGVSREVRQETGLHLDARLFEQVGALHISAKDDNRDVALYEATVPPLPLKDSDELVDLAWHPEEDLPYEEMPADYKLWLPHTLSGYAITAFFEVAHGGVVGGSVFRQRREPLGRLEQIPVHKTTLPSL